MSDLFHITGQIKYTTFPTENITAITKANRNKIQAQNILINNAPLFKGVNLDALKVLSFYSENQINVANYLVDIVKNAPKGAKVSNTYLTSQYPLTVISKELSKPTPPPSGTIREYTPTPKLTFEQVSIARGKAVEDYYIKQYNNFMTEFTSAVKWYNTKNYNNPDANSVEFVLQHPDYASKVLGEYDFSKLPVVKRVGIQAKGILSSVWKGLGNFFNNPKLIIPSLQDKKGNWGEWGKALLDTSSDAFGFTAMLYMVTSMGVDIYKTIQIARYPIPGTQEIVNEALDTFKAETGIKPTPANLDETVTSALQQTETMVNQGAHLDSEEFSKFLRSAITLKQYQNARGWAGSWGLTLKDYLIHNPDIVGEVAQQGEAFTRVLALPLEVSGNIVNAINIMRDTNSTIKSIYPNPVNPNNLFDINLKALGNPKIIQGLIDLTKEPNTPLSPETISNIDTFAPPKVPEKAPQITPQITPQVSQTPAKVEEVQPLVAQSTQVTPKYKAGDVLFKNNVGYTIDEINGNNYVVSAPSISETRSLIPIKTFDSYELSKTPPVTEKVSETPEDKNYVILYNKLAEAFKKEPAQARAVAATVKNALSKVALSKTQKTELEGLITKILTENKVVMPQNIGTATGTTVGKTSAYKADVYRGVEEARLPTDYGMAGDRPSFITTEEVAKTYGNKIISGTISLNNALVLDGVKEYEEFMNPYYVYKKELANQGKDKIEIDKLTNIKIRQDLAKLGIDGVVLRNVTYQGDEVIPYFPDKAFVQSAGTTTGTITTAPEEYITEWKGSQNKEIHTQVDSLMKELEQKRQEGKLDDTESSRLHGVIKNLNELKQTAIRELYNQFIDITSLNQLAEVATVSVTNLSDSMNYYDSIDVFPIYDQEFYKKGEVGSPMKYLMNIKDITGDVQSAVVAMAARRAVHFEGKGTYLQEYKDFWNKLSPEVKNAIEPIANDLSSSLSSIINSPRGKKVDPYYFPVFAGLPKDIWSVVNPTKEIGWEIKPQDLFKDVKSLRTFVETEMRRQRINYLNAVIATTQKLKLIKTTPDVPADVMSALRNYQLTFVMNEKRYVANLSESPETRRIVDALSNLYGSINEQSMISNAIHKVNNLFVLTLIELNPIYFARNMMNDFQTVLPDLFFNAPSLIKDIPNVLGHVWAASSEVGLSTTETTLTKAERYAIFPRLAVMSELFWRMMFYDFSMKMSNNVLDAEATFATVTGTRRRAGRSVNFFFRNVPIVRFRIQAATKSMTNMLVPATFNHSDDPKIYELLEQIRNGGTVDPKFSKRVPSLKRFLAAAGIAATLFGTLAYLSIRRIKRNKKTQDAFERVIGDKFNSMYIPIGEETFLKVPMGNEFNKAVLYLTFLGMGYNPSTKKLALSVANDFTTDVLGVSVMATVLYGLIQNVDLSTGNKIVSSFTKPKQAPTGSPEEFEINAAKKVGVTIYYEQLMFLQQKLSGGLAESISWLLTSGQYSEKALPPNIGMLVGKYKVGSTYNQKISDFFDVTSQMERSKKYPEIQDWVKRYKGSIVSLLGKYNNYTSLDLKKITLKQIESEIDDYLSRAFRAGFKPQLYLGGR